MTSLTGKFLRNNEDQLVFTFLLQGVTCLIRVRAVVSSQILPGSLFPVEAGQLSIRLIFQLRVFSRHGDALLYTVNCHFSVFLFFFQNEVVMKASAWKPAQTTRFYTLCKAFPTSQVRYHFALCSSYNTLYFHIAIKMGSFMLVTHSTSTYVKLQRLGAIFHSFISGPPMALNVDSRTSKTGLLDWFEMKCNTMSFLFCCCCCCFFFFSMSFLYVAFSFFFKKMYTFLNFLVG